MPEFKLGKKAAKKDRRTLQLRTVLRILPPIPEEFDLVPPCEIPTPMFANDKYGNCVIAGRGHQTLRFEAEEQRRAVTIRDADILGEYWREGKRFPCDSKPDRGLVLLDSLKHWRNDGWIIDGHQHDIYAFGQVDVRDSAMVRACLYFLCGANIGIMLPISAQRQLGGLWSVTSGPEATKGSWGGHCVYLRPKCDAIGPYCVTWGAEQHMTWEFLRKYADEFYGIVDNRNAFLGESSTVDVEKLDAYLKEISGG